MRASIALLLSALALQPIYTADAAENVRFEREPLVAVDKKVRLDVREDVVLKPKFSGLAKMTGAGVRWIIPKGEYNLNMAIRIDGKRYLPFPFEPRSWDGRTMQNGRLSFDFDCGSTFQDYVLIDTETGALVARAWKTMDHFCDRSNSSQVVIEAVHQGKWIDAFELESPGLIQIGNIREPVRPATIE